MPCRMCTLLPSAHALQDVHMPRAVRSLQSKARSRGAMQQWPLEPQEVFSALEVPTWKWRCFSILKIIRNAWRFTSGSFGRWSAPCPVVSTTLARCRRWVSSTPGDEAPGNGGGWWLVVFRWFPRLLTYWCLVGNGWQWGNGIIMDIFFADHSLIPC